MLKNTLSATKRFSNLCQWSWSYLLELIHPRVKHVREILVHSIAAWLPEESRLDVRLELEPGLGHRVLVRGWPLPWGRSVPHHPRVRGCSDQVAVAPWTQASSTHLRDNELEIWNRPGLHRLYDRFITCQNVHLRSILCQFYRNRKNVSPIWRCQTECQRRQKSVNSAEYGNTELW